VFPLEATTQGWDVNQRLAAILANLWFLIHLLVSVHVRNWTLLSVNELKNMLSGFRGQDQACESAANEHSEHAYDEPLGYIAECSGFYILLLCYQEPLGIIAACVHC